MTLFRYRPLSDFLFKELFYQELYLATYSELNDPLDLNTLIDFTFKEQKQVASLLQFMFKSSIVNLLSKNDYEGTRSLVDFINNKEASARFTERLVSDLLKAQERKDFMPIESVLDVLLTVETAFQLSFKIDHAFLISEIHRLTKKFFENSYSACFSEKNNDFLMWSHYAAKHNGICLEFFVEEVTSSKLNFTIEFSLPEQGTNKYQKAAYSQEIDKVIYRATRHFANFYDFLPIFINEDDCDVIGLGKSCWHPFANRIKEIFCVKTEPWHYEEEWRLVSINFDKSCDPEERILHYPLDSLKAIYFGMRTPLEIKKRIFKIYQRKHADILFFETTLSNGRNLEFAAWEDEVND